MKLLNEYIVEKLHINNDIKVKLSTYNKDDIVLSLIWRPSSPKFVDCTLHKIIDITKDKIKIAAPNKWAVIGHLNINDNSYNDEGYLYSIDDRNVSYCEIPQNKVISFLEDLPKNNYKIDSKLFCRNKIKEEKLEISITKDELKELIIKFNGLIG